MGFESKLFGKFVCLGDNIYEIIRANNNEENCISLKNTATNKYLRHFSGEIIESDVTVNSEYFILDSTFAVEAYEDGFVLHCVNENMQKLYICKADIDTFIVDKKLKKYVFLPKSRKEISSDLNAISIYLGCYVKLNKNKYIIVPGNDHVRGHVSLLNLSNAHYVRHFDGKVIESTSDMNPIEFPFDSSFLIKENANGINFFCVNAQMQNNAIAMETHSEQCFIADAPSAETFTPLGFGGIFEFLKTLETNMTRSISLLNSINDNLNNLIALSINSENENEKEKEEEKEEN